MPPLLIAAGDGWSNFCPPMADSIEIPESLKSGIPASLWGKVLSATPVVMTVVATMLAGLASSEMNKAQYDRSLAAQLQSKAGDQWGYAATKKMLGAVARDSLDLLAVTSNVRPLAAESLMGADAATTAALIQGELPPAAAPKFSPEVQAAVDALAASAPESDLAGRVRKLKETELTAALETAKGTALAFEGAVRNITRFVEDRSLKLMGAADRDALASFTATRLRYTAAYQNAEAVLNQVVARVYELQVRQQNLLAAQHHSRSENFFLGMLAAQAAVIMATFAMAARKRQFLWAIAAVAGSAAIGFSLYVYLYV